MKVIDERSVELTAGERLAKSEHFKLLDDGYSVIDATRRVKEMFPLLDPAFFRWLNDEPVIKRGRQTVVILQFQPSECVNEELAAAHEDGPFAGITVLAVEEATEGDYEDIIGPRREETPGAKFMIMHI